MSDSVVFKTTHSDGSADFTIRYDDESFKFSLSPDGSLSYEETLSWRGVIRVKEPPESVWRELIQSDEMTEYLENSDVKSVTRE